MFNDIEKYRRLVDAFDLSEEQKVELITSVWHFVEGFVDRAFDHDSYALAIDHEAEIAGNAEKLIDLENSFLTGAFVAANRGEANKP